VAALKTFKGQIIRLTLILLICTGFTLIGPFLTSLNIDYIDFYQDDTNYGIQLFVLTLTVTLVNKILF